MIASCYLYCFDRVPTNAVSIERIYTLCCHAAPGSRLGGCGRGVLVAAHTEQASAVALHSHPPRKHKCWHGGGSSTHASPVPRDLHALFPTTSHALVGGCSGAVSRRRVEPVGSRPARLPPWGGARVRPPAWGGAREPAVRGSGGARRADDVGESRAPSVASTADAAAANTTQTGR